jgi:hypothetical protein
MKLMKIISKFDADHQPQYGDLLILLEEDIDDLSIRAILKKHDLHHLDPELAKSLAHLYVPSDDE